MPSYPSGLIITPTLTQRNISVDLHFEPSVGILARKIDKLGADIRSFNEPLKQAVKEVVIPSIRKNFDSGGRPKWTPLAAITVARKGGDKRPLIRTGLLRREMGYLKIWTIDTEKAMIADLPSNIWYGKVHQAGFGTHEAFYDPVVKQHVNLGDDGAIPARPFVVLQNADMVKIDRIFNRWLAKRVKMAGL